MRFGNGLGAYEIDDLPGCSQVAVSHAVFVQLFERGKGEGKRQHQERLQKLKELSYDFVICTVDKSNRPEVHILESNGWKYLTEFISRKTAHRICIYGKELV